MYVFISVMTIIVWKYFQLIYYYMNLSKLLNNFTNIFNVYIHIMILTGLTKIIIEFIRIVSKLFYVFHDFIQLRIFFPIFVKEL